MKITLVRHAEVQTEYIGKYNGHIDIPLSEYGREQSKELAQKLKEEKFDAVFCSDLLRARQTLEPFSLDVVPTFTASLREKSWGKHEGMSFEEIEQSGIKYENFEQWIDALDGQSIQSYKENVSLYFNNTILKCNEQHILLVTHSGFIKTLLGLLKNIPNQEAFSMNLPYAEAIVLNTDSLFF